MLSFLPIILIGVLFGLAIDYQVFIACGVRGAFIHGGSAKQAVRAGSAMPGVWWRSLPSS